MALFWWNYVWILWDILSQRFRCRNLGKIENVGGSAIGRTIIVTGPTSGLGKAAAIAFVKKGAAVILACRNTQKGEAVKTDLLDAAREKGIQKPIVEVEKVDMADFDSILDFSKRWKDSGRSIDVLVNNAGLFDMGGPRRTVASGLEQHIATNFLGTYLLTLNLLPFLKKGSESSGDSRIVNVSSDMHMLTDFVKDDPGLEKPKAYIPDLAYAQSKSALNMFTAELQRRLPEEWHVTVCAVSPGSAVTDVVRGLPKIIQWIYRKILSIVLLTADEGARSTVYCATSSKVPEESKTTYGYFDVECIPKMPSEASRSESLAKWVWDWAAETTKLPKELDLPPAT